VRDAIRVDCLSSEFRRFRMKTLFSRACSFLLIALASAAVSAQPVAGREYRVIDPPRPLARSERIEVIEFFSYGCPVCYAAEPYLTRWKAKREAEIELKRIPSPLPAAWAPFARLYYALEAIGLLERLHWPVFDNHHFDGRRLNSETNLLEWLGRNDVDVLLVKQAMDSPEVAAKVATARALLDTYDVEGVPTFVIDGRYFTTARLAGGVPEVVEVVDFLVERAREERGRK